MASTYPYFGIHDAFQFYALQMNTYQKFCPNVFVARCEEQYQKGEQIIVETKHGKEHRCIVFNQVAARPSEGVYFYSVVRADGFNVQEWAKRRADRLNGAAQNATKKSDAYWEAANEGKDFLVLGEPIKVGHHSEKRHRALIERNHNRIGKAVGLMDDAKAYAERASYWESRTNDINLSMPESLEYFEFEHEKATKKHADLKSGGVKPSHSYSLTYAKKEVNEAKKRLDIAKVLWGEPSACAA